MTRTCQRKESSRVPVICEILWLCGSVHLGSTTHSEKSTTSKTSRCWSVYLLFQIAVVHLLHQMTKNSTFVLKQISVNFTQTCVRLLDTWVNDTSLLPHCMKYISMWNIIYTNILFNTFLSFTIIQFLNKFLNCHCQIEQVFDNIHNILHIQLKYVYVTNIFQIQKLNVIFLIFKMLKVVLKCVT